jgi:Uma2 family endonuclease
MATLKIELPPQREQTAFNLRRWDELLTDPELAKLEGRIETDRHGHIIMSPHPAAQHGRFQFRIGNLLRQKMASGEVITECPISSADGVKAADVAWASGKMISELGNRACFPSAPEICVEVLSPRNTRKEIEEKMALYFDAGAQEVWNCDETGAIKFYSASATDTLASSGLCPGFPNRI